MKRAFKSIALASALAASTLSPAVAQADGFVPVLSFAAGLLNQGVFPSSDAYTTDDDIFVQSTDGTTLAANVFVPNELDGPAPAVIFINSWALNEYEYLQQAGELAEKGYIVLSYSSRGWGQSEGVINTAGPQDMADFSAIVDYLIANYPVDPENIGASGISYGAGISLLGAAHDPRIKAVAALSGWGSLVEALYGNKTPRLAWGEILTLTGDLIGNLDPAVNDYWDIIRNQELESLPEVVAWANQRSPIEFVDELNENGTAVYLAKAYGDNLFQPNSTLDMFAQLEGPKHIDLLPGTHASADLIPSLVGIGDNTPWENTFQWFDYHLKGENTPIASAKPLNMKVKFEDRFEGFDSFPIPEASDQTYYLHPRSALDNGDLESYPYSSWFSRDNTINSLVGTLFSTQIPLISQVLEQFDIPVVTNIPLAADAHSIYWNSNRLSRKMQIRGNPSVNLQVQSWNEEIQVVAYLYDMDAFGTGTLITHGVITLPEANSGAKVNLEFDLVTTAYDVPVGHRLVLAVDTKDLQYKSPTNTPYFLDFEYNRKRQSTLKVPTL